MIGETLIEDFEYRYPWLYEQVESYKEKRVGEILICLNDGRIILYDDLNYTPYEIRFFEHVSELSDKEWSEVFSRHLGKMIRRECISKERLAERVGVSPNMIGRYLNRTAIPKGTILTKLAEVLCCSVDELIPPGYVILNR